MSLIARTYRRALLIVLLATPPVLLAASELVAAAPAPVKAQKVQSVAIRDFAFVPQSITVAPGTTVTWTNADEDPHTVTATDKSFHSAAMDSNGKFSFTFTRPGEFAYFCSLHPHMTGKVIVKG